MEKHIDMQDVAPGKYVSGPIRPWVETPFLFQHFEITDQSDVTNLPWHCQFVRLVIKRVESDMHYLDSQLSSAGRPDIDPTASILQGQSHGS